MAHRWYDMRIRYWVHTWKRLYYDINIRDVRKPNKWVCIMTEKKPIPHFVTQINLVTVFTFLLNAMLQLAIDMLRNGFDWQLGGTFIVLVLITGFISFKISEETSGDR